MGNNPVITELFKLLDEPAPHVRELFHRSMSACHDPGSFTLQENNS